MAVTGSLQSKNGRFQMVLNVPDGNGKIKQKWKSTGISVQGKTKRETVQNKRSAIAMLESTIEQYQTEPSERDNPLFIKMLDDCLARKKMTVREVTYGNYAMITNKHIKPFFEPLKLKIKDVTPVAIQAYVDKLVQDGIKASSIREYTALIREVCKTAYKQRLIVYNPIEGVNFPRCQKANRTAYTQEQAQQLLRDIAGNAALHTPIVLSLCLGLRREEVMGLRWKDVDFDKRVIRIRNTITQYSVPIESERTKTEAGRRDLPMPDIVYEHLLQVKAEQDERKSVMGNGYTDTGHVHCKRDGTLYRPNTITTLFSAWCKTHDLPSICFHELRHTAVSLLINSGMPITQVQHLLGHEHPSTTLNIYTHINADQLVESARMMDSLLKG